MQMYMNELKWCLRADLPIYSGRDIKSAIVEGLLRAINRVILASNRALAHQPHPDMGSSSRSSMYGNEVGKYSPYGATTFPGRIMYREPGVGKIWVTCRMSLYAADGGIQKI